jgi:hypothetical protein
MLTGNPIFMCSQLARLTSLKAAASALKITTTVQALPGKKYRFGRVAAVCKRLHLL